MMKITKRKIIVFIVVAALAGGGFLAWRSLQGKNQEPSYTTATVERGTIVATVSASGNLLSTNTFTVTTAVTGVVKDIFIQDGEMIEKGQKLLEIEPDQSSKAAQVKAWTSYLTAKDATTSANQNKLTLEKGVRDAQSKLITAEKDFNGDWGSTEYWDTERRKRWEDLQSAKISLEIAKQKYGQADDAITKAQSDLNSAWISYQQTLSIITAPQSGKVSGILVVPGMVLSSLETGSGQNLMTIAGEQKPILSTSVNEIDIGKIVTNQKATVTFDSLADKTFTGKVVGVDRTGSSTQGVVSYPVLIQLDTGAEQLFPNMSATAEIITEAKENALWVPPAAIRTQGGQTVVRVLVSGLTQEKTVEVGLETSDRAEIKSGLSEGETVVVSEQTTERTTLGGEGGFMRMVR